MGSAEGSFCRDLSFRDGFVVLGPHPWPLSKGEGDVARVTGIKNNLCGFFEVLAGMDSIKAEEMAYEVALIVEAALVCYFCKGDIGGG